MFKCLLKNIFRLNNFQKKTKSLYDILKIERNATFEDIKTSYYKLAKQYHPDTHQGSEAQAFKEINEAYNILKNPQKRILYDKQNFTSEGNRKEYKFYNTQHSYGYNASKTSHKNPYQTTNPFESAFHQPNPFRDSGTHSYNYEFSKYFKQSQNSSDQSKEYVINQHRKNVNQNRKVAMDRTHRSNSIAIIAISAIFVWFIGQMTFKIYEFNSFYRVRSYPEKLNPKDLEQHHQMTNSPRSLY